MAVTHKFQLQTLSPVSIGGDDAQSLSPYKDYIYSEDGRHIYYINQKALEPALAANPSLIDEYVAGIRYGMDNNRSSFNLSFFLNEKLGLSQAAYVAKEVPNWGLQTNERTEIKPIEKTAGRAYLPGSSLKGAIRTAILYDWLTNSEEGRREMERCVRNIKDLIRFHKDRKGDRRRQRELEQGVFDEEKLFGNLRSRNGLDSHRILVSDTNTAANALIVVATERIRLQSEREKSTIPTPREAVYSDQALNFTVQIQGPFTSKVLNYWEGEKAEILKKIAKLSQDCYQKSPYNQL